MIKFILPAVLLILIIIFWNKINEFLLNKFKIKLFEYDFISIFNGTDSLCEVNKDQEYSISSRELCLRCLFDLDPKYFDINKAKSFINYVVEEKSMIDFCDDEIYALLPSIIKYKGRDKKVNITLKLEGCPDRVKWVVYSVEADFLSALADQPIDNKYLIPPNDQDLNFMRVNKALSEKPIRKEYIRKEFNVDQLSVFLHLLDNNEIDFIKVDDIQMHFLQIAGWSFEVEYLNRNSSNSGWLITSLNESELAN